MIELPAFEMAVLIGSKLDRLDTPHINSHVPHILIYPTSILNCGKYLPAYQINSHPMWTPIDRNDQAS